MTNEYFLFLNIIGVAFFAISGTLMGYEKEVDGIGVIVLASLTALGGGTLRDILLEQPIFWVEQVYYLYSTYLAIFITILAIRQISKLSQNYLLFFDAVGLGLFNIVGIEKSLINETGMVIAITMGVTTAIFGGLMRDVICKEIPLVMRGELYATACIAGGLVYAALLLIGAPYFLCIVGSMLTTVIMRMAAVHWNWHPKLYVKKEP